MTRTANGDDENSLQLYDVIEAVARTDVAAPDDFDAALDAQKGGPIVLRVRRVVDGEVVDAAGPFGGGEGRAPLGARLPPV